jgi:hypothetical protein
MVDDHLGPLVPTYCARDWRNDFWIILAFLVNLGMLCDILRCFDDVSGMLLNAINIFCLARVRVAVQTK